MDREPKLRISKIGYIYILARNPGGYLEPIDIECPLVAVTIISSAVDLITNEIIFVLQHQLKLTIDKK